MKIYLERFDRKIAGVCGGLAQYFKIDAAIIRLLFVLATICSFGIAIPVYLICWIVFPKGPRYYVEARYKKLYKSRTDRKVSGICGGLGKYFKIDPNIFRVILLILFIPTAFFVVPTVYILAAIIIPEEPYRR